VAFRWFVRLITGIGHTGREANVQALAQAIPLVSLQPANLTGSDGKLNHSEE